MMAAKKRKINRAKLFLDVHVYVSLAAFLAVVLHVLPKLDAVKWSLTWVSLLMMATVVVSGFFGKYVATTPLLRRNWRYFHVPYTMAFYLIILPHVVNEGFKP